MLPGFLCNTCLESTFYRISGKIISTGKVTIVQQHLRFLNSKLCYGLEVFSMH